jgi:hypothetical protein
MLGCRRNGIALNVISLCILAIGNMTGCIPSATNPESGNPACTVLNQYE